MPLFENLQYLFFKTEEITRRHHQGYPDPHLV